MKKNESIDLVNDTAFTPDMVLLQHIFDCMKNDSVFTSEAECCLKLSTDATIRELNNKFFGKDSPTDVLTFNCEIKNIPFLGDIIINIDQADRQRGTGTLQKEVATLFIHALLHLAGFDHLSKKDQTRMALFENKYRVMLYDE